jgi:hypothetical protein
MMGGRFETRFALKQLECSEAIKSFPPMSKQLQDGQSYTAPHSLA